MNEEDQRDDTNDGVQGCTTSQEEDIMVDGCTTTARRGPRKPQQVQWMLLGSSYVNVVEVQLAETDGTLVKFGPGQTIVTLQFRRCVQKRRPHLTRKTV